MPVTSPIFNDFVDVTSFGARYDGTTDCSAAFTAAIATNKAVLVPRLSGNGSYKISAGVVSALNGVQMFGLGNPDVTASTALTGDMFLFKGNNIKIDGIRFNAVAYVDRTTTVNLGTLVRFENVVTGTRQPLTDIKVLNCFFTGAQIGLNVSRGTRVTIHNNDFFRQRDYGAVTQYGCQNTILSGFRALEVGYFEAIKLGASGQLDPYYNYLIEEFIIESCGRLDASTANWQEGIDCFA